MKQSNYEVEILVNGHSVKEYLHEGKLYIEGKKKKEFSLRIRNHGYEKILAVPSVDGLSVMDGKQASFDSRGYIINGHDSLTIDGWRISDKEVAKFYFTNPDDSYSEMKGDEEKNLGVIGIAIFKAKPNYTMTHTFIPYNIPNWNNDEPWKYQSSTDDSIILTCSNSGTRSTADLKSTSADSNVNIFSMSASQDLGTGFGEEKRSEVTTVSFDREDNSDSVFEIFYNTKEQLKKMGVNFSKPVYVSPSAFPKNGYCKPPEN